MPKTSGLLVLVATLAMTSHAAAQSTCTELAMPAEGDTASAQRLAVEAFTRGNRATTEERWDAAERCFALAWETSHVALARYNQAVALRALGRYVESRAAFDEALAVGLDGDRTEQAQAMRAEVASSVATLRLVGIEAEDAVVELDGRVVGEESGMTVECDPGRHTLLVRAPGFTPFSWSGEIVAGTVAPVEVTLSPIPAGGTVVDEPWFWTIIGVVVVGAGVGVGIYAQDQAQLRGEAAPGFVLHL